MPTFRFILSSPDKSELYALGISAKSLPRAREIAGSLVTCQERLISTNVWTGRTWSAIEGEAVSGSDLIPHPMHSDLSIDVTGDANLSFEGQRLKPPVQLRASHGLMENDEKSAVYPGQAQNKGNSYPDQAFVIPEYERPVVVTVLGWFAGFVALGTFMNLVSIDYRYLSTEMISIILAGSILTNLLFFSVALAMSYLHKISFNTNVSNLILQHKLFLSKGNCENG